MEAIVVVAVGVVAVVGPSRSTCIVFDLYVCCATATATATALQFRGKHFGHVCMKKRPLSMRARERQNTCEWRDQGTATGAKLELARKKPRRTRTATHCSLTSFLLPLRSASAWTCKRDIWFCFFLQGHSSLGCANASRGTGTWPYYSGC